MSLSLSKKQQHRYNARQLKKWQRKNRLMPATSDKCIKTPLIIQLDGIQSLEDFYRRLAAVVQLPAHCAMNLDALYDVLTGEISENIVFRWTEMAQDVARSPAKLSGLSDMLRDLPQAAGNIRFEP